MRIAQLLQPFSVLLAIALLSGLGVPAEAAVIGVDMFDYPDGPIAGQSGGVGWDWDNVANTHTGTMSNWDHHSGTPQVTGGVLVTQESGALRPYNGPVTGSGTGSDELLGALRGEGRVYYSVEMTRGTTDPDSPWGGMSSFDFGTKCLFFGVPSGDNQGTDRFFGVAVSGGDRSYSDVSAVDGQTYHMVAELDFDNDHIRLWVDPHLNGFANPVVSAPYDGTNWSTAVRLASGGTPTEWDNLKVTTTYGHVFNRGFYFYENFGDLDGTALDGKVAPVGTWYQASGDPMTVQNGAIDTQGGGRRLFGLFDQPLAGGELVLEFETVETAGNFHTDGWAGISLFVGGDEPVFIGDRGGASSTWGLNVDGDSFITDVSGAAQKGRFTYSYNTGDWEFFLGGDLQFSGAAQPGLAFDRLRIGNDGGGDIAVSYLSVIPEPSAALLAAWAAFWGMLFVRRRKRKVSG